MNDIDCIEIEKLFNELVNDGNEIHHFKDYDLIDCTNLNIEIRSRDNKFIPINFISRHKTTKHLIKVNVISTHDKNYEMTVTSDHICMIYNEDHFFENKAAKDMKIHDYVSIYDEETDDTLVGWITNIEDLGNTDEYVYDCEVDDDHHVFYANDILVHNSQFANIECITSFFKKKFNLSDKIRNWPDEYKLKLWKFMDKFVEETVNPFVQNLVKTNCFTEHPDVLRYSLEYIGDCGVYEQKKRYCVHKVISEGPELVDKLKYTGIELKRSNVSPEIKKFLADIYENTILNDWKNNDYLDYIKNAYDKFCKMSINEISFWKGWNSDKIESDGFLQGGKGMTGISKSCHFYNELIDHLKIGKKYDTIKIGDKIRLCYLQPGNSYGIDVIAFPNGSWPDEFNQIFSIDYEKMFQKSVLDPLKSFRIATRFEDFNPKNNLADDIFAF